MAAHRYRPQFGRLAGAVIARLFRTTNQTEALHPVTERLDKLQQKRKPRYTLDQLVGGLRPGRYRADVEAWDRAPPVGREVF
jgi:hypothetical protein